MDKIDWEKRVELADLNGSKYNKDASVEELYQAFKNRLASEMIQENDSFGEKVLD